MNTDKIMKKTLNLLGRNEYTVAGWLMVHSIVWFRKNAGREVVDGDVWELEDYFGVDNDDDALLEMLCVKAAVVSQLQRVIRLSNSDVWKGLTGKTTAMPGLISAQEMRALKMKNAGLVGATALCAQAVLGYLREPEDRTYELYRERLEGRESPGWVEVFSSAVGLYKRERERQELIKQ